MNQPDKQLRRELGVFGATMLGLGSIVGTGVFVSIGIAAGIAGPAVVPAIVLAGFVAACNALSSAQLAASHPVAGGTYEYGYRYLNPTLGFIAGWLFLCAKSASAATAALGFAGYAFAAMGAGGGWMDVALAIGAVVILTSLILTGMKRTSAVNVVIVSLTLLTLSLFVVAMLPKMQRTNVAFDFEPRSLLHATALMFVAYTGYGRIATLGEEVRQSRKTIPTAIIATLVVTMALYALVALAGVGAAGASAMAHATRGHAAPLAVVLERMDMSAAATVLSLGAITAMLGVLLNLLIGLSRVLLAMGRRRDMPAKTADVRVAVVVMGVVVALVVLIGDVRTTWSLSAFTVLIYYGLTNLAALRLPPSDRLYPCAFAWCGLFACVGLAFMVEPHVWMTGVGLIGVGLVWHASARSRAARD
jgi:APA family basic amino acid/polyamine antiporter